MKHQLFSLISLHLDILKTFGKKIQIEQTPNIKKKFDSNQFYL